MTTREGAQDDITNIGQASPKRGNTSGVLQRIEENSSRASKTLLQHMFSSTDDLFYELSKRATSNSEQNLYFESMREIRIKKDALSSKFLEHLSHYFDRIANPLSYKKSKGAPQDIDENSLSIVEGDVLEVELASKNMANRTRESFKQENHELNVRLDQLLLQASVDENNNPLDPQQVSKAFVKASFDTLELNIKARLILFKLFEKHVLKQLGSVYSESNQLLIDAGILPKVPKTFTKQESRERPDATFEEVINNAREATPHSHESSQGNAPATAKPSSPDKVISITTGALASLMQAVRNSGAASAGVHYHIYCNNPGPAMSSTQLSSALTSKQPVVDKKIAKSPPKNVLHDLIGSLLSKQNVESPQSLQQSEEDTINLVALFFDRIIEDEKLPVIAQSLICRLQIPILKIALNDHDFFKNAEHPARKLINTITKASLQFDSSKALERDPLYRTIVDGIQTINRQYKSDLAIFEATQAEIETLMETEQRKSRVVEARTTKTEIGKAKVKNAKTYAQSIVFEKIKDEHLPDAVSEFITNTWLQVMVITYIKEGKDGAHWVENEQLISDLVWLSKSHKDERSKIRAQRLKPEILSKIEKGLTVAIDNPEARSERIGSIEKTINAIMDELGGIDFRRLNENQKDVLGRSTDASNKAWSDMTAQERQQVKFEELSSVYYLAAKNVPEGTWIEYKCDESKVLQCKLSKKIDSEIYIFVNRFGFKALEKTRREFAYDMQSKNVKILDNTPLFDRIMDGIFSYFHVPMPH